MAEGPINPDREQQRADNVASRRQSGLEPLPKDREDAGDERGAGPRETGAREPEPGSEEESPAAAERDQGTRDP